MKAGAVTPLDTVDAKVPEAAVPRDADHKMEKIWADYESIEPYLLEDTGENTVTDIRVDYAPADTQGKPFQVCPTQNDWMSSWGIDNLSRTFFP
jgi:phosphoinositide-3-kinase regulatory subunit 4